MSANPHNEFIGILAHETGKIVTDQIPSFGVYAVKGDTTPDVGHVDQISLIIRYVDQRFQIQERLLKISEINDKTGDRFAKKVIKMLDDLQLALGNIRFQYDDTTASMSGAYNGALANV